MQTNPASEQSKIVRWSESPWNQSGKGCSVRLLVTVSVAD